MAACDYASAADFLANFKPGAVGCLIVDHHVPDMTGFALLVHLQALSGAPPTIVISGRGDNWLEEFVVSVGAAAMRNKLVDAGELMG